MRNVFISYSRDDLDMVEKEVIPKIEKINGVKCWLDVHDIEAGADSFPDVIHNGLKECFIFLLMLSKSSMQKEWPLKELKDAEALRNSDPTRKVVLVNLDGSELSGEYKKYEERDIIFWNLTYQFQKLLNNISLWNYSRAQSHYSEGLRLEKSTNKDDQKKAFELFLLSAEMGYAEAQSKVAYYYHMGKGNVEKNRQKAIEWCKKSCDQDCPKGLSLMASIYQDDITTYIQYLNQAANKDHKYAQYRLGKEYYHGEKLSPNIISAIYWLKKASDQDEPNAQKLLGHILKKEFVHQEKLAKEYLCKAERNQNKK